MSDLPQPVYDDELVELLSSSAADLVELPIAWDPADLDFTWDPTALDFAWDPAELTIDWDPASLGIDYDLAALAYDPREIVDLEAARDKLLPDRRHTQRRARRAPRGRR